MRRLYSRLTLENWDTFGIVLFCLIFLAPVFVSGLKSGQADEPHPYVGAAGSSLEQRVADLERRVAELENPAVQAAARNVLEVITMENCGPCRLFKSDLQQAGEQPIEIREVKTFPGDPNLRPAFRWQLKSGKYAVQSGYSRGSLPRLVSAVLNQTPKQ